MSSTIVNVCRIDDILVHPGADALELSIIGGWQCVVPKGKYKKGDLITYIPPDSMLPRELSDKLGVTAYLGSNGKVKAIKLRKEPSYGIVTEPFGEEGENVAEKLGITKWEPPIKNIQGNAIPENVLFPRYTGIENLRHFPKIFEEGEEVIVTEKCHGCNWRGGYIRETKEGVEGVERLMVGSKNVPRKLSIEGETPSIYESPLAIPEVAALIEALRLKYDSDDSIVLYGEIYGTTQALQYGSPTTPKFLAFDIAINGQYLNFDEFMEVCKTYGVPTAPVLYRGPYSLQKVKEVSEGPSTIGGSHIREGGVIRPVSERTHRSVGRLIVKYVSDSFLCGKFEEVGE